MFARSAIACNSHTQFSEKTGMPEESFFERLTEEITLPKFLPAKGAR